MVFSSASFLLFFLPLLMVVYFITPKRFTWMRNLILFLFSLFFYAWGGSKYLLLLITSITVNYLGGIAIGFLPGEKSRKTALIVAIILNLGLLGWFKYAGFFSEILNNMGVPVSVVTVILPIGISFYTFQGMSYVIDVYRGDVPAQKSLINIAFYISFFPQLVAGPIVRYKTIAEAIVNRNETLNDISNGLVRFMIGLGKKMLLANAMGQIADGIFGLSELSTAIAWVGALSYTFQIYFDFSAYSDMAIGLGRMFGFVFPENFNYPYIADSITDFWRRWHISLSTWFRDYVYIPLGGNRYGKWKHIRNILVVWLLTGLWHGAAWKFVAWGAWFSIFLLGEKYIWNNFLTRLPRFLRHIYAMSCVVFSWVLFRSDSILSAIHYMGSMFGVNATAESGQAQYYLLQYWPEIALCVIASFPLHIIMTKWLKSKDTRLAVYVLEYGPKATAVILLLLSYLKLSTGSFNPFIYFQF